MRTFTAITRVETATMPPELALLDAPVGTEEPSAPGEYVGRTEGVVVDEHGAIVAFLVQLTERITRAAPALTLVPVSAARVRDGRLDLTWTEGQLLAQPRLDHTFYAHSHVDGGTPVESKWMPARPNVAPPGSGVASHAAAKEGVAGGAIGAAIGAAAGIIVGGPVVAAAMAVFFAAGGSLAGLLSGGSQESASEASELRLDAGDGGATRFAAKTAELETLASALADPALRDAHGLRATRFVPLTSKAEAA